jgi:hypothetical protein
MAAERPQCLIAAFDTPVLERATTHNIHRALLAYITTKPHDAVLLLSMKC